MKYKVKLEANYYLPEEKLRGIKQARIQLIVVVNNFSQIQSTIDDFFNHTQKHLDEIVVTSVREITN